MHTIRKTLVLIPCCQGRLFSGIADAMHIIFKKIPWLESHGYDQFVAFATLFNLDLYILPKTFKNFIEIDL